MARRLRQTLIKARVGDGAKTIEREQYIIVYNQGVSKDLF